MLPRSKRIVSSYCIPSNAINFITAFQARYIFAFMAMLGLSIAFMMRLCISLVITILVDGTSEETIQSKTYPWDEKTQGIILSIFYLGYAISHIPGALLSEKFGGKYVFGLGILSTAIFTLLTPLVIDDDPTGFIILRFLEGVGEGPVFPALYTLLARWAPPNEKTYITTVATLGGTVGQLLANLITGIFLQYGPISSGWRLVFYFFGSIGTFWYLLWWLLCYSDPNSHPYISDEERHYFIKEMECIERNENLESTPWKCILTSRSIWVLIIVQLGHDWGGYIILTDLTKYLNDVLKFSPVQNGLLFMYSQLLTIIVSWIAGVVCDSILYKKLFSVSFVRKLYASITTFVLAAGLLIASYLENSFLISFCVIVGISSLGLDSSSICMVPLDLSPNYCGSIFALINGISSIAGLTTPNLIGLLTPNKNAEEWRLVFWIMGGILLVTNFIFLAYASFDLEPWNENVKTIRKPVEKLNFQKIISK